MNSPVKLSNLQKLFAADGKGCELCNIKKI